MKRIVYTFLIIFLHSAIGHSQSEAHQIIAHRMESKNIPGIAFLIAKDEEILEEGYYGKANLELDVAVTKESVFAIASMSKTYMASAILLMAEQGLLHLDDSIKKYIPEAPNYWTPITIKHLLTHSSGLVEDWSLYDWNGSIELFLKTQTNNDFLKVHFKEALKFDPGTDVSYASGHFILGIVIERITGEFYGAYLEKNIFKPLSLHETYIDHPYKIIPNRVSGYFFYDTNVIHSPVSGLGNGMVIAPVAHGRGDSGIRTTAKDLMKFYSALLTTGFLNEQSRKIMFEAATLDNGAPISTGVGWMNWPLGGIAISEHSGGFRTGFSSQSLVIPEDKFMVIVLTNLKGPDSSYSGASFPLTKELASLYYPDLKPLSKKPAVDETRKGMLESHLNFFQQLHTNELNATIHPNFPFSYYSKNLKMSISETESIKFLGDKNVEKEEVNFFNVNVHHLRYYRLNGKQITYTTIYLDGENRIIFMDYPETE